MKTLLKVMFFPLYVAYVVFDKVTYAMMNVGPYGTPFTPKFPQCRNCGVTTFDVASKPIFTTNRYGEQRITVFVDCTLCGLRHRALRSNTTTDGNWSFTEPS